MQPVFSKIDILRFALAVYLMVFHTIGAYPESRHLFFQPLLGLGGFATSTFFLLSGFILSHVYFGESSLALRGGAREFLVKRLATLYPTHLISLLFFIIVSLAAHQGINHFELSSMAGTSVQTIVLGPLQTAFNLVLTLLMLHAWNPLYVQINPPSWSLSALFFFYLVFPLIAPRLLSARRKPWLLLMWWCLYLVPPIVAGSMQWYSPAAVGIVTTWPLLRLPEFLMGIVLYGLYRDGRLEPFMHSRRRIRLLLASAGLCFLGGAWLLAHGPLFWAYLIHNGALLPAELALLLACLGGRRLPDGVAKLSARLGNAALSIFAIHLPVFLLFVRLQKFLLAGMSPQACLHDLPVCVAAARLATPGLSMYPLYLIGTIVMAVVFQERVVAPIRDGIRQRLLARYARSKISAAGA